MSLTAYFRTIPESRQQVQAALRKNRTVPVEFPLLAPSLGTRPGLVGTAFDYLFRSLLVRLHLGQTLIHTGSPCLALHTVPDFVGREAQLNTLWAAHRTRVSFEHGHQHLTAEVAHACLVLASFDVTYRVSGYMLLAGEVHQDDVQDLLNLAALVPLERFRASTRLVLNPTFGQSARVWGADADVLIDDILIDIKTSVQLKVRSEYLQQLSGYLALAQLGGIHGAGDRPLQRLGIYFARYGVLHTWTLEELYMPGGLERLTAWFDQAWAAMSLPEAQPARYREGGVRHPEDEAWMVVPGYQPLPGPQTTWPPGLEQRLRFQQRKPALRSTLIARRPARALLGGTATSEDIWVVATLLAASPLTRAPLAYLQARLTDVNAIRQLLAASRHTDAWWLSRQDDLESRCTRLEAQVQSSLMMPLSEEDQTVLAHLLPCAVPLSEHMATTPANRAAVKRLVARGLVLQDGRSVLPLTRARVCLLGEPIEDETWTLHPQHQ